MDAVHHLWSSHQLFGRVAGFSSTVRVGPILYPPNPRFGFHPYLPERLGYRNVLKLANPRLARLLQQTDPHTLLTARNRTTLYREGLRTLRNSVPGAFVEIGVHRGGSAGVLAQLLKDRPDRELHLFDRWGDLPDPTAEDGIRGEEYRKDRIQDKLAWLREDSPLDATRQIVEGVIGFPSERLRYHQGWYDDTLKKYDGGPIAFASLDCDYYESVKLALAFTAEHASPGAVVIIDDYGSWPGAKTAVHEWIDAGNRRATLHTMRTGPAILRLF